MAHRLSLIVSTLGRSSELSILFDSLARQTFQDFDVVVVDQNADSRVADFLAAGTWPFPVDRIATPDQRGLSRGRNVGWRSSSGEFCLFPDDDCWYPEEFLARSLGVIDQQGADLVTGRAVDAETLRPINGRFEPIAQSINRENVWTTQIEWTVTFKRHVLESLNGYDDSIGVGATTPWQACEGQDITLRAIESGFKAWYDPALFAHHAELDTRSPDVGMRRKGRGYGRGLGYVLRRNGYGPQHGLYWVARPSANAALNLARGRVKRSAYLALVALGRAEGYLQRTL